MTLVRPFFQKTADRAVTALTGMFLVVLALGGAAIFLAVLFAIVLGIVAGPEGTWL